MPLRSDIQAFVEREFAPVDQVEAIRLLEGAVLHDGQLAGDRCRRSALVASSGSLKALRSLISLLAVDFRDVILAGEYEGQGANLRRVRDLNEPFDTGAA